MQQVVEKSEVKLRLVYDRHRIIQITSEIFSFLPSDRSNSGSSRGYANWIFVSVPLIEVAEWFLSTVDHGVRPWIGSDHLFIHRSTRFDLHHLSQRLPLHIPIFKAEQLVAVVVVLFFPVSQLG